MKRRTAYLCLAIAAVAAAGVATQWQMAETAAPAAQAVAAAQPIQPQQSALPERLPERATLRGATQPLFGVQAQPAPKRAAPPPQPQPVVVRQPPTPPYRYVGSVAVDNKLWYVLAEADKVFPIEEGEIIGAVYRVEAVGREKVTLRYVPLDALVELPLITPSDGRGTVLATPPASAPPQPASGPSASALPQAATANEPPAVSSGMRAAQLRGPRNPH